METNTLHCEKFQGNNLEYRMKGLLVSRLMPTQFLGKSEVLSISSQHAHQMLGNMYFAESWISLDQGPGTRDAYIMVFMTWYC